MPELQKQVYKVIVKIFLAIFYPPAEYEKVSVTILVENEEFSTSGRICKNEGYLYVLSTTKAQNVDKTEENMEKENNVSILKKLKKNEEIPVQNYETKDAETSTPNRYNSGSMILALENAGKLIEEEELREQIKGAGIGTSAKRAERCV